jgi:PAS domain S-box-containing protein
LSRERRIAMLPRMTSNPPAVEGLPVPAAAGIDPQWYRQLVESAPDAMVLIDAAGKIILVNAQTERLFGYPRSELLGQTVELLVPERFHRGHSVQRERFFGEPKVREMGAGTDLWGRRKDGTEFAVEISLSPQRTPQGMYVTASIRDATARKRANDKVRALLETAPDAMVIIDQSGVIRLVNAQAERIFGYSREALVGERVEILIPEALRGGHHAHRDKYFHSPKVRGMGAGLELSGRRRDGTEFPIEISLSPLETEEGVWATAAVRDVTERRRERDASTRLAAIVESSNDIILGKDLEGRITSWNHAAEMLLGYTAKEVMGRPVSMLFPTDRAGEEAEILARVRRGEQIKHFDTVRVTKSGRPIDVSLTISPIRDAAGRLIGASTIGRDVTERRRAQARFSGLLEAAPDAMVIINSAGIIELVNAQAQRMFGYGRDELVGKPVELLIPGRFHARHMAHRAGFSGSPKARSMGEGLNLLARRRDGSEFPVEISLGPLQTDDGTLITAAVRDISERKTVERKLAEYAETLERSNRELEQFAYVASHDLSAPLRSVNGFAQLLERRHGGALPDEAREYIKFICESAAHMQSLIDGLLTLSRVGRSPEALAPIEANTVFDRVLQQMTGVIGERKAIVTREALPAVLGSELELFQLFQNLISNGIKFHPGPAPQVHVSARRIGDLWEFSVRDDGIGIKPEHQEKIFMIFQRLHTAEQFEGTGIGLAICKKIVQHHGGRIGVKSAPGEGATFTFTLRAAD